MRRASSSAPKGRNTRVQRKANNRPMGPARLLLRKTWKLASKAPWMLTKVAVFTAISSVGR
ncbi:hypothetical protein D9M69_622900 [compost metagenome]